MGAIFGQKSELSAQALENSIKEHSNLMVFICNINSQGGVAPRDNNTNDNSLADGSASGAIDKGKGKATQEATTTQQGIKNMEDANRRANNSEDYAQFEKEMGEAIRLSKKPQYLNPGETAGESSRMAEERYYQSQIIHSAKPAEVINLNDSDTDIQKAI